MKTFLNSASRFWYSRSLGILLIRLEVGFIFFIHGLSKVENMSRTMQMFANMGFPSWVGAFIGILEVVGGLALIFGVLTRVFAVAFGIQMLVAVYLSLGRAAASASAAAPSWQSTMGGMEMFLAIMAFALALMGSGRYALWARECRDCGGMACAPGEQCPGPKNPA